MTAPPPPPGAPPPAGAARRLPLSPLNATIYRLFSTFVNFWAVQTCARAQREHQGGCAADRARTAREQGIDSVHAHADANCARVSAHATMFLHACMFMNHISCMCACIHRHQGARGGQPHGPAVMTRLASARQKL